MGMVTAGADDTADAERQRSGRCFEETDIIAVNRKTAGVSTAGTYHPMELQTGNKIIIKIWR